MSTSLKYILAVICFLVLGNLYYAQPIISDIAPDVGIELSGSGIIVTVTQIGYCLGVLFLVPLGDVVENRRLLSLLVWGAMVALVAAGLSHHQLSFLSSVFFVGLFSCSMQVIIPLSAGLAGDQERGRVLGLIISGGLLGIVLSRPTASLLTGLGSWRFTYFYAAGLMVVVGLLIRKMPRRAPVADALSYPAILSSMVRLFISVPGIKRYLGAMALIFMTFTLFWATVPIVLQDVLHFSHTDIAIFSLISLAAPPCALMAGKMIDRGKGFLLTLISISMVFCAFIATPVLGMYLFAFMLAALLLEPGVHMTNVVIQQAVIAFVPEARSRLNALCIAFTFTGGAVGSWLGPWLYSHYGWKLTVAIAGVTVLAALTLNVSLRVMPAKQISMPENT
ncbi:MFS transporter [Vibrio mangrovi]|uniref:MFS transporter n=1 Tax=Vibrio mangrovi TaxID=474394 RepID=A0A1Y6IVN1_9VIBR|nr:MFS transporter [Vibrio mangrovi]MDW6004790.1 MFS transporter [Vibrio mangrovi]SMS01081.1 putative arabinose transporter [Vibrio mangrovi]